MKNQIRVSQLTLELYYRGLADKKERRMVENALDTDSEVRKRYLALQKSDNEICQIVSKELNRLNFHESPIIPSPRKKRIIVGFILAAAIACVVIPAILYLKKSDSNIDNVIAEENTYEIDIEEMPNNEIADNSIVEPSEPPVKRESVNSNNRNRTTENPRPAVGRTEPVRPKEPEKHIEPERGVSVAEAPTPDTGVRLRGTDPNDQGATAPIPEEPSNINIPPGMTFIFENMFANRDLSFVIIPSRITSIGKNAFGGNPLLSVTIGANVSIEENAIPGNFAERYNLGGKAAGTYTRPNLNSVAWEKK